MKIEVTYTVATEIAATWDSEPNDRAPVKMAIAEAMGRIMRTHDLIEWRTETLPSGELKIGGHIEVYTGSALDTPDYTLSLNERLEG